jgi:hypothetical protein
VGLVETDVWTLLQPTFRTSVLPPNAVASWLILSIVNMELARSSETSVLTRLTWRNIPEDGILHSRRSDAQPLRERCTAPRELVGAHLTALLATFCPQDETESCANVRGPATGGK